MQTFFIGKRGYSPEDVAKLKAKYKTNNVSRLAKLIEEDLMGKDRVAQGKNAKGGEAVVIDKKMTNTTIVEHIMEKLIEKGVETTSEKADEISAMKKSDLIEFFYNEENFVVKLGMGTSDDNVPDPDADTEEKEDHEITQEDIDNKEDFAEGLEVGTVVKIAKTNPKS